MTTIPPPSVIACMSWHARRRLVCVLAQENADAVDRHREIIRARGVVGHARVLLSDLPSEDPVLVAERHAELRRIPCGAPSQPMRPLIQPLAEQILASIPRDPDDVIAARRSALLDAEGVSDGCDAEGCDRDVDTAGYCAAHYKRVQRFGHPMAHIPLTRRKPRRQLEEEAVAA